LVDLYLDTRAHKRDMILGVVGRLQFDVVQHRILGEYGVRTSLEPLDYQLVRWLDGSEDALSSIYWGTNGRPVADRDGRPACLLVSERAQLFLEAQNKDVKFLAQPPEKVPA
jgi:peptide chain release factor 3